MCGMKPLTNPQKSFLASLAREGWQKLTAAGAIDEDFETWRRREAVAACGRSISQAGRGDFDALQTHFFTLAGKVERALKVASNPLPNDLRGVLHCLEIERKRAGVSWEYVQGICRRMFRSREPETVEEAKALLVAVVRKRQAVQREARGAPSPAATAGA